MEKYIPDIYQKSIYTIDYQYLKDNDIKCLFFDLEDTLVPITVKEPTDRLIKLFKELKALGFKIVIVSNTLRHKLKAFKQGLEVEVIHYHRLKKKQLKLTKYLEDNKYDAYQAVIIGDEIIGDIACGNTIGITSILVNSICNKLNNCKKEKECLKKLSKLGFLKKGKYYD